MRGKMRYLWCNHSMQQAPQIEGGVMQPVRPDAKKILVSPELANLPDGVDPDKIFEVKRRILLALLGQGTDGPQNG